MFKKSELKAATAMLIIGYTRDEGNDGELILLRQALDAIREEVADWEESFEEGDQAQGCEKLEMGCTSLAGATSPKTVTRES